MPSSFSTTMKLYACDFCSWVTASTSQAARVVWASVPKEGWLLFALGKQKEIISCFLILALKRSKLKSAAARSGLVKDKF